MNSNVKRFKKFVGLHVDEPEFREFHSPNIHANFCSNAVSTSQYNLVTFLPVNLFIQFKKPANVYFLVIAIMQLIPAISLTGAMPTVAIPLAVVVIVTMIKDGMEDYKRHVSDRRENSQSVCVIDRAGVQHTVAWHSVKMGDLLVIQNRQPIPSDLVLIASSESGGVSFVETSNLDGETNLKLKTVPKEFLQTAHPELSHPVASTLSSVSPSVFVHCQLPNKSLYEFEGYLKTEEYLTHISADNVLLRGCRLRNTRWIVGLVVYTGRETKIQMNTSTIRKRKISRLEKLTNKFILISFFIQMILCFIGALVWSLVAASSSFEEKEYLNLPKDEIFWHGILKFFSLVILFSNFIPISLTVTMGIVKIAQAYVIEQHRDITVRCSDLNEELGQVDFLFSDKTGTLTKNLMEFRKLIIGGQIYGKGTTEIRRNLMRKSNMSVDNDICVSSTPHVNFQDERFDPKNFEAFLFSLAVNHSVVVEENGGYSGSSPDETALVYTAKHFGFELVARSAHGVTIGPTVVETLCFIEFDSFRKRSSLLCRVGEKLFVHVKGADSVMEPLVLGGFAPDLVGLISELAQDGLRLLCIARKEVDQVWATDWVARWSQARLQKTNPESLISELETGLTLLGVTAVEDKLQANVAETIDALRQGGVKVWMLTGDKMETAVNIGLATSLLASSGMYLVTIDGAPSGEIFGEKNNDAFFEFLQKTRDEFQSVLTMGALPAHPEVHYREVAIVIDGRALECILANFFYRQIFAQIAVLCSSVICCRVSPEQKGGVVSLIRRHARCTTLAIGDGANDCNMLTRANIGVGLKGHEGMQAFNSSDYGVEEFQTLKPLLLVHGRWAYRRIGKLILYMFYKNIVICLPSYFINILAALFSGQRIFEEYMYQLFNVVFTALPILIFGVFEQDLNWKDCLAFPQLYKIGPNRVHANVKTFILWIASAVWHGVCVFFVPYVAMGMNVSVNSDGIPPDLFLVGAIVYLSLIVVVNLKLVMEAYYLNGMFLLSVVLSIGFWFAALNLIEVLPLPFSAPGVNLSPSLAGLPSRLYKTPMTFFVVFATVLIALTRDFLFKAFRLKFRPRDYHLVMSSSHEVSEKETMP